MQGNRPQQRGERLRATVGVARPPAAAARCGRTRMVGIVRVEALLHPLRGDVECCAEALGRDIADDERSITEQTAAPAPTMYLGLDGTGVPVRPTEVEGRRGKQPDGSAKTREVKLATVWTAEGRDTQGHPVRDLGSVSYNAAVESAARPRHRPAAGRFRTTGLSRGNTARFRHRSPARRPRRRRRVDLQTWSPSSFPAPSRSLTSTTPSSTCAMSPRPSTAPGPTWLTGGPGTGAPNSTPAGCAPSSPRCASMSRPRPRRESAFTTCSGTDTACAIRSSAPGACASRRASSRPDASRSATGSSAPACAGPSPGPTHHRPALLHPQRTLRGLLGATSRKCRLTLISQWCRAPSKI